MNTKKLIIFILILIIILGAIFAFFFFRNGGKLPSTNNDGNPFPVNNDPGFGSFPGNDTPNPEPQIPVDPNNPDQVIIPTLRKLSNEPTSGLFLYSTTRDVEEVIYTETGEESIVIVKVPETKFQIIERKNGHITEFNSLDLFSVKKSNTSIIQVRNALGGNGGYLLQYLNEIQDSVVSFLGQLDGAEVAIETEQDEEVEPQPSVLKGAFLPEDVISITLSADKKSLAFLVPSAIGSTLYTTPVTIYAPKVVTELPLQEIEVLWPNTSTFIFYTRSDSRTAGSIFSLGKNGELQTLVSEIYGATTITSPDGKYLFMSYSTNNGISTAFINLATGESSLTPIQTMAEKCVWSTVEATTLYCGGTQGILRGSFPEEWYMGSKFFADIVWKLSATNGEVAVVSNLDENNVNQPFDLTHLTLSQNDDYLMFINKYDRAPWVLDLKQAASNFDVPTPSAIENLIEEAASLF